MNLIWADWDAPIQVKAVTTTRIGGFSSAPYDQLNLGDHVGDSPEVVERNRSHLFSYLGLTKSGQWLQQIHGIDCVMASSSGDIKLADACVTSEVGLACVVMTADCLPVFFASADGQQVAVAHAGWRGLVNGVLESTLQQFQNPETVHAWFGPAIGPDAFEVGAEVVDAFVADLSESQAAFKESRAHSERSMADIYHLARLRLNRAGVSRISGGQYCTYSDEERFYSYRREPVTGRMASLIWIEK